jgi:hypothetical protein
MVPYQISQVLMNEHVHELHVAARRHERAAEARRAATGRRAPGTSRLREAFGHLVTLAHLDAGVDVRRSAPAGPTTQGSRNGSTAGPMGCVA